MHGNQISAVNQDQYHAHELSALSPPVISMNAPTQTMWNMKIGAAAVISAMPMSVAKSPKFKAGRAARQ